MSNQPVEFSDAPSKSVYFPVKVIDSSNAE